jgi:hypothetical protein
MCLRNWTQNFVCPASPAIIGRVATRNCHGFVTGLQISCDRNSHVSSHAPLANLNCLSEKRPQEMTARLEGLPHPCGTLRGDRVEGSAVAFRALGPTEKDGCPRSRFWDLG